MKHVTQRLTLNVTAQPQAPRYLDNRQRAGNIFKHERDPQRNSTSLQTNLVSTRKASAPVDIHALPTWLTDDFVMPAQFFQPADRGHKMRAEVALLYAVLDDAIWCLRKGYFSKGRLAQRLAVDAELWIFADDHRSLFTFVNICAVLGLDPAYLRSGLQQWRAIPTENITSHTSFTYAEAHGISRTRRDMLKRACKACRKSLSVE